MNTQIATEAGQVRAGYSAQARVVRALGPLTSIVGLAWGVVQPWRITFLHPHGQGFWWLAVEPPLLVILVGFLFSRLVAPGLIADLEDFEEGRS